MLKRVMLVILAAALLLAVVETLTAQPPGGRGFGGRRSRSFSSFQQQEPLPANEQEKKILEVPIAPRVKVQELMKLYEGKPEFREYLDFYLLLRRLIRAEYTSSREFRRHVTMTATLENSEVIEVKMDTVQEYFEKTKSFLNYIKEIFGECPE